MEAHIHGALLAFLMSFFTGAYAPDWVPPWVQGFFWVGLLLLTVFVVSVFCLMPLAYWLQAKRCPSCGKRGVVNVAPAGEKRVYRCEDCGKYQGVEV